MGGTFGGGEGSSIRVLIGAMASILIIFLFLIWLLGPHYGVSDEPPKRWYLDEPEIWYRTIGTDRYMDVTVSVDRVEPEGDPGLWTETFVTVLHANGTAIMHPMLIEPDDPSRYDDGTDGRVYVEAWYTSDDSGQRVRAGDTVKITGLEAGPAGARVRLDVAGRLVAEFVIPSPSVE